MQCYMLHGGELTILSLSVGHRRKERRLAENGILVWPRSR